MVALIEIKWQIRSHSRRGIPWDEVQELSRALHEDGNFACRCRTYLSKWSHETATQAPDAWTITRTKHSELNDEW